MLRWFDTAQLPWLTMDPGTTAVIHQHQHDPHPDTNAGNPLPTLSIPKAGKGAELNVVGSHLYLERDGTVLLGQRHPDSSFAGGLWHALAGHVERESARACVAREAMEEAGLDIDPRNLELVHTVHMLDSQDAVPRIGLFFRARQWKGTPQLLEPDRCSAWAWWPVNNLPADTVPYTRVAIEGIAAGRSYSELGWTP